LLAPAGTDLAVKLLSITAVWSLSFFMGLHPCILLKIVFKHDGPSSMSWDFNALGFLHVVCVVLATWFDDLGLKKEFVNSG
jgi:hypothetical protein